MEFLCSNPGINTNHLGKMHKEIGCNAGNSQPDIRDITHGNIQYGRQVFLAIQKCQTTFKLRPA
jgi:hypothetical protein